VKLDFGLSAAGLHDSVKKLWPFAFNLIYSVTLNRDSLTTSLVVTNDDDKSWDCQVLMHTYLRVKVCFFFPLDQWCSEGLILEQEISAVSISGLDNTSFVDKVDGAKTKTQPAGPLTITGETDRVYIPASGSSDAVNVLEGGKKVFTVTRDNLANVVVWNPWTDKAAGMGDFAPKDGFKNMLCIEPGSVSGWQTLEPGDAFEGAQTITYHF